MKKITMIAVCIAYMSGCSSKEEKALVKEYKENKTYFKMLQKTEKILFTENNITKAVFTATYITPKNTLLTQNDKDELFIVGLYIEDEEIEDIGTLFGVKGVDSNKSEKKYYELTLNGKKALHVEKLGRHDSRLDNMTLLVEWATYAAVTFEHSEKKRMKMLFTTKEYGQGTLPFSKVAKYVFTKKAF